MHEPDTAETSLAAWSLCPPAIWLRAFWTPPRQVCSVLMFAPCKKACTVVVDSDAFVDASCPSVVAIDACSASRLAVVTALA